MIALNYGFISYLDVCFAVVVLSTNYNFVMHNAFVSLEGKRAQANKMIAEFLSLLAGELDGFSGYMVMNSIDDGQGIVVLTFWETKQSMDAFYHRNNAVLNDFAQRLMPLVEKMEQIKSYQTEIADFIPSKQSALI